MFDERRPKILLICEDERLLFEMHRTLYAENDLYDVFLARNGTIARRILRSQAIDVLVSNANPRVTPESDLVTWVARESPATRMLLLMGVDARTGEEDCLVRATVRCLGTPVAPQELRRQVRNAIEPQECLAGKLGTMPFADIIQLLCGARKSTALHIYSLETRAFVLIANGEVVHAQSETAVGIDVLSELIALRDGTFHLCPLPEEYEVTMTGRWKHLLMQAAQRLDERNHQPVERSYVMSRHIEAGQERGSPGETEQRPGAGANGRTGGGDSIPPLSRQRWRPPESDTPPSARWPPGAEADDQVAESAPESSESALSTFDSGWPSEPPSVSGSDEPWDAMPSGPEAMVVPSPSIWAEAIDGSRPSRETVHASHFAPPVRAVAPLVDRGFMALREGDLEAARQLWLEAYRMDPGNRTLALNLRRLDAKKRRSK